MAKIRLVFFILGAFIFLTTLVQNCNGQKKSKKSEEVPKVITNKSMQKEFFSITNTF